jgi:GTPase SAR1 family protein
MDEDDDLLMRAEALKAHAAQVFKPRTPITTRDLFAGRWSQLTAISDAVHQAGLHVVVYGERGVGKTSLANVVQPTIHILDNYQKTEENVNLRMVLKETANTQDTFSTVWHRLFQEILWPDPALSPDNPQHQRRTQEHFALPEALTISDVRRVLAANPGCVYIIDEFDQASRDLSKKTTELIKALSDLAIDCTIIIVGVSETVDMLVEDHGSISRHIDQVHLERMAVDELKKILQNAEKVLQLSFSSDAASLIVSLSQGLPHYTHLIGLHAVREAADRLSLNRVEKQDVLDALTKAVKKAEQSIAEKHAKAVHSAHKSALYRKVLLAAAVTAARDHDALGYFVPSAVIAPLTEILEKPVTLASFTNHLTEFTQEKRGSILQRDGEPWSYRYRFTDPLLVPFVFMDGIQNDAANSEILTKLLAVD